MTKFEGHAAIALKDIYEKTMKKKGYAFFSDGIYNINIIGVRATNDVPNMFNDHIVLIYKDLDNKWITEQYAITTDPGQYWLNNPSRVTGTAILVPGQYRGIYKIDLHNGRYEALCQRGGAVMVYRDSNRDEIYDRDPNTIEKGYFGINIHRASRKGTSEEIDKWSAGCQVFQSGTDFEGFMKVIKMSAKYYGNSFTYTLLNEEDLQ
jgi:hypothetical protein